MLYNNKKTLSALALILAMSFSLAGNGYAQGVITIDEDADELGLLRDEGMPSPRKSQDNNVSIQSAFESGAIIGDETPVADGASLEIPLEAEIGAPAPAENLAPAKNIPAPDAPVSDIPAMNPASEAPMVNPDTGEPVMGAPMIDPVTGEPIIDPATGAPMMDPRMNPEYDMYESPDARYMPERERMMRGRREADMKKGPELGNSVLSQVDNDLFNQMSEIEKQTTLLSLELRREKLQSEIDSIKAARDSEREKSEAEKNLREQKQKELEAEKEIEKIKEQQILKDKEIALEALRQEKALDDYKNKMLESEQRWIAENQRLYNKIQSMDEERKAIITSFNEQLNSLNEKSKELIQEAEIAKENFSKTVANLNMQNAQLKKRLEAESSVGKNPFGENDANGQIDENTLNRDYVIMEIRGKGDDLVAKLINKEGESFQVKKGSVLKSGHKIEKITHNYITLDKNGIKDYLQFTAGGVVDKEPQPTTVLSEAGAAREAAKNGAPVVNNGQKPASNTPPLLMDNSIPSLGNGMFVK